MKLPESLGRLPLGLKVVIGAAIVFIILAIASQAKAQSQCAPEAQVREMLDAKYNEVPMFRGVAANGTLLVVWGNSTTGTWTITVHNGAGAACLIASGDAFEALDPPPNI